MEFKDLIGKTLTSVENIDNEELVFTVSKSKKYKLYHDQDCCEDVRIEDVIGDLNDLVGSPIVMAEEATSEENPEDITKDNEHDSFTWTFYKLATVKGYVTVRWYGESNGYYSESVDFIKL